MVSDLKILDIGQSCVLKSDVELIFGPPYVLQKWVWTWSMPKDVTFKMGYVSALKKFIAGEKLCINPGSIRFQDNRLFIILNSWNLIPHTVLLISRLPDIVQKSFCTPDWIISQPSRMFMAREIKQKLWHLFLWTPSI